MTNLSDFNDLAQTDGLEAVRAQVAAAVPPSALLGEPPPEHHDDRPEPPMAEPEAPAVTWPDPILPGACVVPDIPARLLPGCLGEMAQAVAKATQTPTALSVMLMLSVLATALQRRFEVAPYADGGYTEPLSLWTVTALPSGSRKTAVLGALTAPLLRWEKRHRDRTYDEQARVNSQRGVALKRIERLTVAAAKTDEASEREALRAEIELVESSMPQEVRAPRLFSGDTTPERLQSLLVENGERMAVISDEGGILQVMGGAYSNGPAMIDTFLQSHAGSAIRVDRAGRTAHIDKPALSFGLALQPGILSELASSKRFRDSGLLARFLFAVPASNVGQRDVRARQPVPEAVSNAYEARVLSLLGDVPDLKPGKPRVLIFSDAALELWLDLAEFIERGMAPGGRFAALVDWTSKLPGALARIAALMELAESGDEVEMVHEDTMRRAVELGELLIDHAQAAFRLLGADSVDTDARAVLDWMRGSDLAEFTQRECQRAMSGRFSNPERMDKALERLMTNDVLRRHTRANKGARASKVYLVNPKALSSKTGLS